SEGWQWDCWRRWPCAWRSSAWPGRRQEGRRPDRHVEVGDGDQRPEADVHAEAEEGRGRLTGAMVGRDRTETMIDDAKYKDGERSFTVTRERNGQKFTIKYKAKVEGDTIKGKAEANFGGQTRTFDFEGKRDKDK